MKFQFSRRAIADLDEIAAYIAADSPRRAVTFVQELRDHCRSLVAFPKARPLRPELGEGVRVSVFGSYLVMYVATSEVLEIRRVVYGARDLNVVD